MRDLPNIEKSVFRRGEYVGYGGGKVWQIYRHRKLWVATERGQTGGWKAETLADLSKALENNLSTSP